MILNLIRLLILNIQKRFLFFLEDILVNDYSILSQLDECYFDLPYDKTTNRKGIHIDSGYFEEVANTLHLITIDYNSKDIETLKKICLIEK